MNDDIYIRSLGGKFVKIVAVFPDADTANTHMENNPNHGVISELNGVVFVADVNDWGVSSL